MKRFVDIVVVNNNWEILLLRRSENSGFMPGKLCLPGGHVETGSSLLDNAKRELEEETGFVAKHLTKVENYTYKTGDCSTIYVAFTDVVIENQYMPPMLTFNEHTEYEWVNIKDIDYVSDDLMPELLDILKLVFNQ